MADKRSITLSFESELSNKMETISIPIAQPCDLTEDESKLLEDLTGNEYHQALRCAGAFNGHICLVGEDGIDELSVDVDEWSPAEVLGRYDGIYPNISGYDYVFAHEVDGEMTFEDIKGSQNIADIFLRCDTDSSINGSNIEIVERDEPDEVKERRFGNFAEQFQRLPYSMAMSIKVVDFRHDEHRLGSSRKLDIFAGGRIAISPDELQFDQTFFHEAAHQKTSSYLTLLGRFENDWMLRSSEVYVGDAWDNVTPEEIDSVTKFAFEDGILSWYSRKNMQEDISEITGFVYTTPGYVGWVASESQRLWEKVQFLYDYEYISEEQMIDVLEGDYSYIEREWKLIAGEPVRREAAEGMSEDEGLGHGLLAPTAARSVKEDILFFLDTVKLEPRWLREAAQKYPLVAAKIEYLYANRMITSKQYDFLVSEKLPEMPDLPYCAQPICDYARDSFWGSVECYFNLALDNVKFINALMMPI